MMYYIQAAILTFIEASCCKIFLDTFLIKKYIEEKWINRLFFIILFAGFMGISYLPTSSYIVKALLSVILIGIIVYFQYKTKLIQAVFLSFLYYGLVICIDRIMMIIIQFMLGTEVEKMLHDPLKITILALLCKMVLFLLTIFLNKKFKPYGSFNLITDKEWVRFLFFPVITISCMSVFAIDKEKSNESILVAAFALALLNLLEFYIIQDIVEREQKIQKIRVSQERIRNQMNMYQYMEGIYSEQRKKVHEFKNYLCCIQGLLKSQNYLEVEEYVNKINNSWIEEMDLINTNNAIVNSVLNQKYKLAKRKGIPIILEVNDLADIPIEDEDIVILLANLLDNAIEACEKIQNGRKIIKLRFINEAGKITISIRNSVSEPVKCSDNEIITTKDNKNEHGVGLSNIRSIVDKYGGEDIWSCNDGYFTHSVIVDI